MVYLLVGFIWLVIIIAAEVVIKKTDNATLKLVLSTSTKILTIVMVLIVIYIALRRGWTP